MNKFILGALAAGTIAMVAGVAQAGVVTFDDAAGNSILDVAQSQFSDQGLTFTTHGTYMYVWDATNPNGNGSNANIFAGFNSGDYEAITLTGGGTFDLDSIDLAVSWYDSNPSETIFINGSPLTITQTYTTYDLNLDGVSEVDITGVPSNGGYWLADNITINSQVPEPITVSLFGAGLVGAAMMRRRKKSKQV